MLDLFYVGLLLRDLMSMASSLWVCLRLKSLNSFLMVYFSSASSLISLMALSMKREELFLF